MLCSFEGQCPCRLIFRCTGLGEVLLLLQVGLFVGSGLDVFSTGERVGEAGQAGPLSVHLDRIEALIGHDGLDDITESLTALADDTDPCLVAAGKAFARGAHIAELVRPALKGVRA